MGYIAVIEMAIISASAMEQLVIYAVKTNTH